MKTCFDCLKASLEILQEIRTVDPSKCLKKTETKISAPRVTSIKKTIKPDESFYKDILNFNDDDTTDLRRSPSPLPSPSLSTQSKLLPNSSEIVKSPVERNKSRTTKPLRQPLTSSSSKCRSVMGGGDQLESVRLSLFEFSHIRVQETRAELECCDDDDLDDERRTDLEMGRVCFCCKNTRFRMLNWAYNCHFCKKNVCSSCYIRLKLPVEKLREVTVASLMSQLSLNSSTTNEDDIVRSSKERLSGRSSSIDLRKSSTPTPSNPLSSVSNTSSSSSSSYRPRMLRSGTTLTPADGRGGGGGGGDDNSSYQLRSVCVNCKQSLINTIR